MRRWERRGRGERKRVGKVKVCERIRNNNDTLQWARWGGRVCLHFQGRTWWLARPRISRSSVLSDPIGGAEPKQDHQLWKGIIGGGLPRLSGGRASSGPPPPPTGPVASCNYTTPN